jgi:hypothetical protein
MDERLAIYITGTALLLNGITKDKNICESNEARKEIANQLRLCADAIEKNDIDDKTIRHGLALVDTLIAMQHRVVVATATTT